MYRFSLGGVQRLLCLGAHSDDLEIGCGGTILRLLDENPQLEVTWVVFSSTPQRALEAKASAMDFLQVATNKQIVIHSFRDAFFPYDGPAIKERFEEIKTQIEPDLILTHCRHDLHQDHRVICELTWNTFRNHLIWEYEIPKYDGDLGSPNLMIEVSQPLAQRKIDLLMQHFATQSNRYWFTPETFWGLMRIRGVEGRTSSGYAEGFYCKKWVL